MESPGSRSASHWFLAATFCILASCSHESTPVPPKVVSGVESRAPETTLVYPWHRGITATIFWVGEAAAKNSPANTASAWDPHWMEHFGGVDEPAHRAGYRPAGFVPRQNPFYVALPYNDMTARGRRPNATQIIPWAGSRTWADDESMCRWRWICIMHAGRSVYAQWLDVGPFVTDDAAYVFGDAPPRNASNNHAGIDLSPAARDFLALHSGDAVDWRFVDDADVPQGPWKP